MPQSGAPYVILIMPEAEIGSGGPANLPCNIVKACQGTGTDADGAVHVDPVLHQRIKDSLAVESAECSSFQYQASLRDLLRCISGRYFPPS